MRVSAVWLMLFVPALVRSDEAWTLKAGEDAFSVSRDCGLDNVWNLKDAMQDLPINPFEAKPGDKIMIPAECKEQKDKVPQGWGLHRVGQVQAEADVQRTETLADIASSVLGDALKVDLLFTTPDGSTKATDPLTLGSYVFFNAIVTVDQHKERFKRFKVETATTFGQLAEELFGDSDHYRDIKLDVKGSSSAPTADAMVKAGDFVWIRVHHGDMIESEVEYKLQFTEPGKPSIAGAAVGASVTRWPAKQSIPYCLASSLSSSDSSSVTQAIAHIEQNTCIRFSKVACSASRKIEFYYDPETNRNYCYSWIGMRSAGGKIASGCGMGVMVHEIGHAIGLFHEQSRSDRDQFITVNFNKIDPDWRDQYDKENTDNSITPYDYDSIMHYSARGGEMTAKTGDTAANTAKMGNRKGLSRWDIVAYNYLLGYAGGCSGTGGPSPTPRPGTPTNRPATPTPRPVVGGSCAATSTWANKIVACDDCWALVPTTSKNCNAYCASIGHTCAAAAEEVNNDCQKSASFTCAATVTGSGGASTSDMLCKCTKSGPTGPSPTPRPGGTPTPKPGTGGVTCSSSWPNRKMACSNCWALVNTNQHSTCEAYCSSFGHKCIDAAEEQDNDCNFLRKYSCSTNIKTANAGTSDMLCQCAKTSNDDGTPRTMAAEVPCTRDATWPDVKKECDRSCTVLIENFTDKYERKCSNYCKAVGKVCTRAWEQIGDSCSSLFPIDCDVAVPFKTTDAVCECELPTRTTNGPESTDSTDPTVDSVNAAVLAQGAPSLVMAVAALMALLAAL